MSRLVSGATALLLTALALVPVAPAQAGSSFTCAGEKATIVGTPDRDVLNGTPGPDVIVGRAGRDTIRGGGGQDLICGSRGGDRLSGGDGNDQVYGGPGYDTGYGDAGDDVVRLGRGVPGQSDGNRYVADAGDDTFISTQPHDVLDYANQDGGSHNSDVTADLTAGSASGPGFGHDTLRLSSLDRGRTLWTSNGDDTIVGGPGPDAIETAGGVDHVSGAAGNDFIESSGRSTVSGGLGDDTITLANGGDGGLAHGDEGNDTINLYSPVHGQAYGDGGDDTVVGDTQLYADQVLSGGDGTDTLQLGVSKHDDYDPALPPVHVDLGAGTVSDGVASSSIPGFENVTAGEGLLEPDAPPTTAGITITGTDGPNALTLGSFEDGWIYGLGGDDHLVSTQKGDDLLDGGPGTDSADAGAGQDTCTSVETRTSCEVVN